MKLFSREKAVFNPVLKGVAAEMKMTTYEKTKSRVFGVDPISESRQKLQNIEDPEVREFLVDVWNGRTMALNKSEKEIAASIAAGSIVGGSIGSFMLGGLVSQFGFPEVMAQAKDGVNRKQNFDKMYTLALKEQEAKQFDTKG